MKDYELTCYTAHPNPGRGPRPQPEFQVIMVEQCGPDEFDVWVRSDDTEWWLGFNDWLLSHITAPTWIGHHAPHHATFMLNRRDALLFKLKQTGWSEVD